MEISARELFPNLPHRIEGVGTLAENLWWSWQPGARMLFKLLDRQAWKESGHNPDRMLRELPAGILEKAAASPGYLRRYDAVLHQFHRYIRQRECPLLPVHPGENATGIAYFSAEYGLHRSLPFYAGGLGFLAGDHLKECSDLNVPVTAVGFMYPEGYLYQKIREDGWQENIDEVFDRDAAAISRVNNNDGGQLVVRVPLIQPDIHVAVWRVAVGRVVLYLMDTDIEVNDPWNRSISARLYTGDREQRLRQEILLGIGGTEVLRTLGVTYGVLHLNEGHAAFALLESIRERVAEGLDFEAAYQSVRNATVFTTHTPVPAGHDIFPFYLMEKYFGSYWPALGLDRDRFMQLGVHPAEPQVGFNMTAFALKASAHHNAVSRRHAEVTRRMWQSLWPTAEEAKVPIDHVTNGVHISTWLEPKIRLLFDRHLGSTWLEDQDDPALWGLVDNIPDEELWQTHYWLKIKLIDAVRERSRRRWMLDRSSPSLVLAGGTLLDPSVLTIGFARRFAAYKRADLILTDRIALQRLLCDRWRPIQIIFAGKAHPADDQGKLILQKIVNACRDPATGGRIAFVEDYGEQLAQYLVHGVDVWLNTPLPPLEACGTSGMKAALNGVPQLSILDGWWIEGYKQDNGWAFEHREENGDRNGADAAAIYRLLEEAVIPTYYATSEDGIPHQWVAVMKAAIKYSAAKFSARRMVKDYIEKYYSPALASLAAR
jgi:starch phosphorylase